jgi:hypothetical protein
MYYFEYDKEGYLYKYTEKYEDESLVLCDYFLNSDTVIKLEENGKYKNYIKYECPVQFKHRFEAGESWVTVTRKVSPITKEDDYLEGMIDRNYPWTSSYPWTSDEKNPNPYYEYPNVKSQLNFKDDEIYNLKFKIKKSLINNWYNTIDF